MTMNYKSVSISRGNVPYAYNYSQLHKLILVSDDLGFDLAVDRSRDSRPIRPRTANGCPAVATVMHAKVLHGSQKNVVVDLDRKESLFAAHYKQQEFELRREAISLRVRQPESQSLVTVQVANMLWHRVGISNGGIPRS